MKRIGKAKIFFDTESTSVSKDADIISIGLVAEYYECIDREENIEHLSEEENPFGSKIRQITEGNFLTKFFYAEFTDFDINKCDDWVKKNIVETLPDKQPRILDIESKDVFIFGDTNFVSTILKQWLSQFNGVEFWCDFGVTDTPFLIDLIADWDLQSLPKIEERRGSWIHGSKQHKIGLPKHLPNVKYYDFYDIHSVLKWKGIDPDINREEFVKEYLYKLPEFILKLKIHNSLYDSYINYLVYNKLKQI